MWLITPENTTGGAKLPRSLPAARLALIFLSPSRS
jgi:hypothetical protein